MNKVPFKFLQNINVEFER